MNGNKKDLLQEKKRENDMEVELSLDELKQVSGGVITEQGAAWLTKKILEGKAVGATKEKVAFFACYSSGKGDLAHASGDEAAQWVLDHWDHI